MLLAAHKMCFVTPQGWKLKTDAPSPPIPHQSPQLEFEQTTRKEILFQGNWCLGVGHRCNITPPLTSLSLPNLHVHLEAKVGRMCVHINKDSPQLKS